MTHCGLVDLPAAWSAGQHLYGGGASVVQRHGGGEDYLAIVCFASVTVERYCSSHQRAGQGIFIGRAGPVRASRDAQRERGGHCGYLPD
jgi:hypothetical protein